MPASAATRTRPRAATRVLPPARILTGRPVAVPVATRRQVRGRQAASSSNSMSNSLSTTPTTTDSSNQNSPGLFYNETDSDEEEDSEGTNYDDSVSSPSDEDGDSDDDNSESSSTSEEDYDEEEEPEPAAFRPAPRSALPRPAPPRPSTAATTATTATRTRSMAPAQSSSRQQPPAPVVAIKQQSPQRNLKRSRDEPSTSPASKKAKIEKADVVDMIHIDDDDDFQKIMHEQMIKTQREEGNARRKIADFKCVICLDDPENLSATPCGHLFCNDCIKTTLRFGRPTAKFGKCPVCRGKVVIKEIVPLELKLIKRIVGKGKGKAKA